MNAINRFLIKHNLRLRTNPCVSPDFCLDWPSLAAEILSGAALDEHGNSEFETAAGRWRLLENAAGDHAWRLTASRPGFDRVLDDGLRIGPEEFVFPASFENLLRLKNLAQEYDESCTIFPVVAGQLGRSTLGIGARFTTLHWPAVEWAMAGLRLGLTANQNSIPRELVYDVDKMLGGELDSIRYPFIGTDVPEGHQGQSVKGMSHGAILSKLKTGFHLRRIPWSFNADHQPIGGRFDGRESQLVDGSILASYITFDLSPELAMDQPARPEAIDGTLVARVKGRVIEAGCPMEDAAFEALVCRVWPAVWKMHLRDDKYKEARRRHFTTEMGRRYLRELSIDELPGITPPETTAVMLALCEMLGMPVNFIAPAFGFQKNTPVDDNLELRGLIERQWKVCRHFGVSMGFHSGSGKSPENYRVMGEVTGGRLEIKTSGRYTYEMAVALSESSDANDRQLWNDWYRFTMNLALSGAFSGDATERRFAQGFISAAFSGVGRPSEGLFASPESCRARLESLPPSPGYMFFFEYNFLFVLADGGRAEKSALGSHTPGGYAQRARFYSISDEGRLRYAKGTAAYILFLAEHAGLADPAVCGRARLRLEAYSSLGEMLADIPPGGI